MVNYGKLNLPIRSSETSLDFLGLVSDPYRMESKGSRIRYIREDVLREDQAEFGKRFGVTNKAVSQWESNKTQPTPKRLAQIAALGRKSLDWLERGVETDGERSIVPAGSEFDPDPVPDTADWPPVVGEVEAGIWREVPDADVEYERSIFPPDPRYPLTAQFDLRVRGQSLNKIAKPGMMLRCVRLEGLQVEPKDGDLVIAERRRAGGTLIETTAKRLRKRGALYELWPESDHPDHQTPVPVIADRADEEAAVVALVLYAYADPAKTGIDG